MEKTDQNCGLSEPNNSAATLAASLAATLTLGLNGAFFKFKDDVFLHLASVAAYLQDLSNQQAAVNQVQAEKIEILAAEIARLKQSCADVSDNSERSGLLEIPELATTRH